jgi:ABC-type phosphate transport system permease subunit
MMMTIDFGVITAIIVAIAGAVGGVAALLKVNADNSKTITEGATSVVKLLRDQIADLDARLTSVEEFSIKQEEWSDSITALLTRAISQMTEPPRSSFRQEAADIAAARPQRRSHPQPVKVKA